MDAVPANRDLTPAAYGVSVEQEPSGANRTRTTLTLLLTARRCPIECAFCDLWRHNHAPPTPAGSIPIQIEKAIEQMRPELEPWPAADAAIKLYNGGNFTDPLSIPPPDWPRIAELCQPFGRVIIENHANMCGDRLLAFRDLLDSDLEVAIGLETADEEVLARQRKRMTLADFDRAADYLSANQISLRCFVLLQLPYADSQRCVRDAVATVQHAIDAGAVFVTIIPTRSETREMQDLVASGDFVPPTLEQLERALFESLAGARATGARATGGRATGARVTGDRATGARVTGGRARHDHAVVTADPWDLETVSHCGSCQAARIENIRAMNHQQRPRPLVSCSICLPRP